jgi:DNA modification methylase
MALSTQPTSRRRIRKVRGRELDRAAERAIEQALALPSIEVEWVSIGALRLSDRRMRSHDAQQVGQIAASIREFGFLVALIVASDGEVIAGEGRLEAAELLGLTRVPVIRAHHLTALQIRQFRIADNKLAERADWNDHELRLELSELVVLMPELNFEPMGITLPELDVVLAGETGQQEAPETVALARGPATSRLGDTFEVRGHRIYCGNSCLGSSYQALARGEQISVVFADGPWNVKVQGHIGGRGRIRHAEFKMASGEMSGNEFAVFQKTWLAQLVRNCPPGALIYAAIDWRGLQTTLTAAAEAGLELINLAIWCKSNGSMGSFLRSAHEMFPIFRVPGAAHVNNVELGRNGRYRTNVWTYAGANVAGAGRKALALHPTPKPVPLVADILLDCTQRGDIVLDPFGGAGATLIAAERTGRFARMIELDPVYVDTMVRRFEAECGEAAVHVGTGLTLDQLALRRASENENGKLSRPPRRRIAKEAKQ